MRLMLVLLLTASVFAGDKKSTTDPRIREVKTIFVAGNNQAAEEARKVLAAGKTCFALATKQADADATLDLSDQSGMDPGGFGTLGQRHSVVSGTLTLKSGDLLWSHSERWSDRPFKSGAKQGGELLVKRLAREADCKSRK